MEELLSYISLFQTMCHIPDEIEEIDDLWIGFLLVLCWKRALDTITYMDTSLIGVSTWEVSFHLEGKASVHILDIPVVLTSAAIEDC